MVMKLWEWMRWPREGVENDKRIHLPVPSIPGPLTPPGPIGRGERADNTEHLPSRLHPSSYTIQRDDAVALLMSPGSGVTKQILLPPSLPPGVAWLPLRKLLQSSQLSWPEAAREEIPPSLMGGGPAPGNSTKAVTRAGLAVCELTHREHSGYLLLPFFPAILFS